MAPQFHILLLEDNRADLLVLKQAIRDAGVNCEFTEFSDGAQAMACINQPASKIPDLVILDLNIPKVEGASVLNSIRANPRWSGVDVFMFTASQNPADLARVKLLGADGYFIKPMDLAGFAKIGSTVKDWLEQSATLTEA